MKHFSELSKAEVVQVLKELGLPAFRYKQLQKHYYEHYEVDTKRMSDIPKAAQEPLAERLFPRVISSVEEVSANRGETVKTLWELGDSDLTVESVLMRYPGRITLCISSQVGCAIGCPFCATGQLGLERNLSTSEILEQYRLSCVQANERWRRSSANAPHTPLDSYVENVTPSGSTKSPLNDKQPSRVTQRVRTMSEPVESSARVRSEAKFHSSDVGAASSSSLRVDNVVFMGMGEPLANMKAVTASIKALTSPQPDGFGISARNITVSTSGIVPQIDALADLGLPVRLAVSLHAPNDELRDMLVPINKSWNIEKLLEAAFFYFARSGRRVSIEYILIADINDSETLARELARRLKAAGNGKTNWCHVNTIMMNKVEGSQWTRSTDKAAATFLKVLANNKITATMRDSRGSEADAACGQLASRAKG